MKKVFDQTVRDLKREVNKKVLKVPGIEQKVLDATSNEPWGPHGSLLADIALATRNYHEYQMIMTVIWKRINDTGKNWRHVYKALTVLDYLVAHGSERVIEEIREHAYQISTLSDFQYIDSSGRDQGSNVRKKSQSLVVLVNDKERIIEVRQKAAANRDKFRSASSSGGMYRPGSYSGSGGYGDRFEDDRYEGRYGSRDDDRYSRNGDSYGREKEWGYRDDDRYGRNGDSYSRDGDRYGREYEDRYGRDSYRDDDYRGRSRSVDENQYGQRSRSSDRDRERSFDDDGQYSSRSGARGDDSQDGRRLDRKFSEQNIGAPPSYEEVISESRSPVHSERDGETPAAAAPTAASPAANNHPTSSSPPGNNQNHPSQPMNVPDTSVPPANQEVQAFDEFDPRGAVSAKPADANNAEVDLLGGLALAIVPTVSGPATTEAEPHVNSGSASTFVAAPLTSNVTNQAFEDPFGDTPFKAIPSDTTLALPQASTSIPTTHAGALKADSSPDFGFGDSLSGLTYSSPSFSSVQTPTNPEFLPQELPTSNQNTDILADILPPSGPSPAITLQPPFSAPAAPPAQPGTNAFGNYQPQPGSVVTVSPNMVPQSQSNAVGQHGNYLSHAPTVPLTSHVVPQMPTGPSTQFNSGNYLPQGPFGAAPNNGSFYPQQGASTISVTSHTVPQNAVGPAGQLNNGTFLPQQGAASQVVSYQASSGPALQQGNDLLRGLTQTGQNPTTTNPGKDKFETKSTVWADTLSRGLVNLNISGPKTNPLANIGIDFDALNRKEKRMEKPAATPVTSTVTMGKAMGSGSGMGRAVASVLRPPLNPMMGSGMGMGMGMGGAPGVGLYGGMNQQPMGMGMGMNMGGMGQGPQMQPPAGFPPGSNMPGVYNPMMGTGGYGPQQPYGGYR